MKSEKVEVSNSRNTPSQHAVANCCDAFSGLDQQPKSQIISSGLKENEIWTPPNPVSPSPITTSPSRSKVYDLRLDGSHLPDSDDFLAAGLVSKSKPIVSEPQAFRTKARKITRYDQVNWMDPEEIHAHFPLFSEEQQHLLNTVSIKPKFCPPGVLKGNYFQNIHPIIASNHPSSISITCCGRKDKKTGRIINCDQWHLCSRCAFRRFKDINKRYSTVFNQTHLFHLTCSFNEGIPFGSTNSLLPHDYWNGIASSVKAMVEEGWVNGAYLVHELSIRSLIPLMVVPHSHIVLSGDRISQEFIPTLTEKLLQNPAIELEPSLDIRLIENQRDFSNVLKYQTEAIDLKEAYDSSWLKHITEDRKGIIKVNHSMKEFLDAYSAAVYGFERPVYFGNLRSQNRKAYIGKKKPTKPKKSKNNPTPSQ